MKLVNQTALPAVAMLSELPDVPVRIGLATAKATFGFDEAGRGRLEPEIPDPLHGEDVQTDEGIVPPDLVPRRTDALEVFVVGKAHADGGRPTRGMNIGIELGAERREALVFGDRVWEGDGARARISEPLPFVEMPLTWDRAFGGNGHIFLDATNAVPVTDRWNPHGKGFDTAALLKSVGERFGAAPGFPLLHPHYRRSLPNIEHPAQRIARWDDEPEPWCFSTVPMTVPYRLKPLVDRVLETSTPSRYASDLPAEDLGALLSPEYAERWDQYFYRSHPAMRFSAGTSPFEVGLRGVVRGAPALRVKLPRIEVLADYSMAGHTGTLRLAPQSLVILPEQRRITVTFRKTFSAKPGLRQERSFRLRVETL
jgi:hypothetical protein